MSRNSTLLRLSVLTFIACAIWLIGLGGYFILVRPPLLPEDLRYLHVSAGQITMYMPLLASWLDKFFSFWADSLREAAACFSSLPYTCCHNAFPARVLPLDVLVPA